MIVVEDLCVRVGTKFILKDVNVEIPTNTWTCLVGPNGAGKTTFLKALLGVTPYSGSLRDNGVEVFRNHQRNVAFVPQHPNIPVGMTVAEYVRSFEARWLGARIHVKPSTCSFNFRTNTIIWTAPSIRHFSLWR